jgi:short-subunit dehydrogenase
MLTCDVTDDGSVAKLVDKVLAEAGRIDLLVNNAGMGLLGGAEESSIDQAKSLFEVNVFCVLRMTNAVLPAMRRQRSGRIINLSSVQGFIPAPYFALPAPFCPRFHIRQESAKTTRAADLKPTTACSV